MNENLQDKKIAVLLSGGVESSVVLYELVQQGLTPIVFISKLVQNKKKNGIVLLKKTLKWRPLLHTVSVANSK